ncbi:serine hydrolase [Agriterribacter sp.]|uniref:serine hydrolase n=1 Tax=Agriterribacter sp. TaxID=2821509 RepID=UPI002BB4C464|nr:serine hydrolase [Agriterribacter sp.]HRP56545.1 serine hydrolase [Agriterribacter sp.]
MMHIKRDILSVTTFIVISFFACKTTQKATAPDSNNAVAPTDTIKMKDSVAPLPADTATTQPKDAVAVTTETPVPQKDSSRTDAFLEALLQQYPQYFDSILSKRAHFKVQIIYTQINRDADNTPHFTDYYFHVNSKQYFYPASTVKMPVALLALQRLNELNIAGLNRSTAMITGSDYSGQTAVYNDPTTPDGSPSVEQYIKKIFLASDNDAFNRLYEFLGQRYINDQLHRKGYKDVQINHRLNIALPDDENRHTNPVQFRNAYGQVIYDQPGQYNAAPYLQRNDRLGKAYYKNGALINGSMDFSIKNRISLEDLHHMLRSILFPQSVPATERFTVTPEDYRFVWQYMSQLPQETIYPPYDSLYYDASCKFLLLGADKNSRLPRGVRIFNKIGGAYGFLTDAAYIVDFENQAEFMLSAVIYCNEDGIINDGAYDYATTGFPFMKRLGEVIYRYELKREKKYKPNLSAFKIQYDRIK